MRDVAKESYEKLPVGGVGFIRPDASKGETIEGFQAVVAAAEIMQADGLIIILDKHRESQSGRRQIDAIQFRRIK